MICSDPVAENLNDKKLYGTEFCSTKLAADVCLPKMVAGLLSPPKRSFIPPKISWAFFYLQNVVLSLTTNDRLSNAFILPLLRKFQLTLY